MVLEGRCHVRLNCDSCDNYQIAGTREFVIAQAKKKGWKVNKHGGATCPKHKADL